MVDVKSQIERWVTEENVLEHASLNEYTTFKVGGPAKFLVKIQNEEQLQEVVRFLRDVEYPYMIIGNGSNLLVSDKGYNGVIIKLSGDLKSVSVKGDVITAFAGATLGKVTLSAYENSLSGLEFAHGIPGTLGGAVYMNAGAYGGEMKDVVTSVKVLDENNNIVIMDAKDMDFSYRHSICKERELIIISAAMKLKKEEQALIKEAMDKNMEARVTKQPLDYPSAGSTFKRPEGYFAGKLIGEAGLSGYKVGGAEVSSKHNGFVINSGGATAGDISNLIKEVKDRVYKNSGVMLEEEVIYVGDFQ